MKICIIGTGYVGLVTGACFAEMGNDVICVDKNTEKLDKIKQGIIPIYEPGLEMLIKTNVEEKRLTFSDDTSTSVKLSDICFIAVGTPQGEDGSADLQYVYEVAETIGKSINGYKVIVDKSTVPVGTAEYVAEIIGRYTDYPFDVVSNPEFLKQGNAVEDFLKPDRVIIGADSNKALDIMINLYEPFVKNQNPIITMDTKSAEMVKYASNSFLAVKISYINEIANICEKVGADINMVRKGMCADSRIGNKFLYPGIGYGGSCFPKDIKALIKTAVQNNCDCEMIKAADLINKKQRELFTNKILSRYGNNVENKIFAVWGLSFKPKTNDMREAPSITIISRLLSMGAKIKAFDPKATDSAKQIFGNKIEYSDNAYSILDDADGLILLTEWNEFRNPDFERIKTLMKDPVIFDGRNQYNPEVLKNEDIELFQIGKTNSYSKTCLTYL